MESHKLAVPDEKSANMASRAWLDNTEPVGCLKKQVPIHPRLQWEVYWDKLNLQGGD